MTAETTAVVTLLLLCAGGTLYLLRWIASCGSFSVWLLSLVFRVFCVLRMDQRVFGPCPLPVEGGALLVSNHRSPLDPALIFSASLMKADGYRTRVIEFLTASEYCLPNGPMGWIIRTARSIPVDRDGRDMAPAKEAMRRLHAGRIVGIFPEGGIHLGPGLREFDTGVAWLALRGNVPVIPVIVQNTPYREPIMSSFLCHQPANVVFGEPIDFSRWDGARPTQATLREVADYLQGEMLRLKESVPPLPVDWGLDHSRRANS